MGGEKELNIVAALPSASIEDGHGLVDLELRMGVEKKERKRERERERRRAEKEERGGGGGRRHKERSSAIDNTGWALQR